MPTAEQTKSVVSMPLSQLQAALAKINPAMPGPSVAIPALRAVRIEKLDGGTTFTATDLEMSVRATVPAEQDEAPAFLLSGERVMSFAKLLAGSDVHLTPGDTRATLRCGKTRTQIPTLRIQEYPATKFEPTGEPLLSVPQSALARAFRHTAMSIGDDPAQPSLSGALLEVSSKGVRVVATNGHRLAMYDVEVEGLGAGGQLVPGAMVGALGNALDEESPDDVSIYDSENNLLAVVDDRDMPVSISHRKLSGRFPQYALVIPKSYEVELRVSAAELLAAAARCTAMSDVKSFAVNLRVSPEMIELRAVDDSAGENDEQVAATALRAFPQFVTRVSGKYLLDALKRVKGDVLIRWEKPVVPGEAGAMCLSCSPADGESFLYVLMAMTMRKGEGF